jgi:peptide methionine sulfoxide reductase MsrA
VPRTGGGAALRLQRPLFVHDPSRPLRQPPRFDGTGALTKPIVTEIVPAEKFYVVKEYHQRYLEKQVGQHAQ